MSRLSVVADVVFLYEWMYGETESPPMELNLSVTTQSNQFEEKMTKSFIAVFEYALFSKWLIKGNCVHGRKRGQNCQFMFAVALQMLISRHIFFAKMYFSEK